MAEPMVPHKIALGDQTLHVRIHPGEREFHDHVARYVAAVHEQIRREGATGGAQAWAMAAFQIALEVFDQRGAIADAREDRERIERLVRRIDAVLPPG